MPRGPTEKVESRKKQIIELLKEHGELTTSMIMKLTGLSHSQVFYTLRLLADEGIVQEVKRGKVAYWKLVYNNGKEIDGKATA